MDWWCLSLDDAFVKSEAYVEPSLSRIASCDLWSVGSEGAGLPKSPAPQSFQERCAEVMVREAVYLPASWSSTLLRPHLTLLLGIHRISPISLRISIVPVKGTENYKFIFSTRSIYRLRSFYWSRAFSLVRSVIWLMAPSYTISLIQYFLSVSSALEIRLAIRECNE